MIYEYQVELVKEQSLHLRWTQPDGFPSDPLLVIQAWPLTILPDSRSDKSGIGRKFQHYPSNKTTIRVSKSPFHWIYLSCYWIRQQKPRKKKTWKFGCNNILCSDRLATQLFHWTCWAPFWRNAYCALHYSDFKYQCGGWMTGSL